MKTSLKVSVALALTAAFASTGALAEASKDFSLGGFARYDVTSINVDGGDSTFGDGHRVQLNAVGKGTNSNGYFVKGVGQIRLNNGGFAMADAYVQAGNQRVNVQAGRFYDMSVWDERGTEKFVSEDSLAGISGGFYTAESPRNGNNEAHVAVNYTPSKATKAQLSVRYGKNVDEYGDADFDHDNNANTDAVKRKYAKTSQIRPAISYDAGRYNVAAAYQHRVDEEASTANGGTGAEKTTSGIVASIGTKFTPSASASLNLSSGKVEETGAEDVKRSAVGISGTYKQVEGGILTAKDTQTGAEDKKTTAIYADYTRPLMGIKGAKTVFSAYSGKMEQGATEEKATGLNARLQYNF